MFDALAGRPPGLPQLRPARPIVTLCLLGLIVVATVLRVWYATGLPLSGDEVGVGVLQATGQAATYGKRLPDDITSLRRIHAFIDYDPAFSPRDVVASLRHAGMHPPLYYFLLHYLIRFVGNDVATLRSLSIVFSLASVLALYALGRALHGRALGIAAAGLLALAPYGVIYGSLVRPYPLAMLLALVSTGLAIQLGRRQDLSLRQPTALFYVVVSILGAYTIYQFAFVLALQFFYLALAHRNRRSNLIFLATSACLIGASYVPWTPSLWSHLADITGHQYYFHQPLDLWRFGRDLFALNFGVFLAAQPALTTALIGLPFYGALLLGLAGLWRDRATRPFLLGLGAYLGIYFGLERWFRMSTLAEPKFLFFIVPLSFLVAGVGIGRGFQNATSRAVVMACGLGVVFASAVVTCAYKDRSREYEEERYVLDFAPTLNRERQEKLLLINTSQRRYLFPLAHALHASGDVYILREVDGRLDMPDGSALDRYHTLYLANLYVDYEPQTFLSEAKLDAVTQALRSRNFHVTTSLTSGTGDHKHSLFVFATNTANRPVSTESTGRNP